MQAILSCLLVALVVSGCSTVHSASPAQTSPTPHAPQLRITNSGPGSIGDLTVVFPRDKVFFGNVPAGGTTKYLMVPGGVYRYSAAFFSANGKNGNLLVMDWGGEAPMEGQAFTYTVQVVEGQYSPNFRIVNVKRDK